jgi:hypothetical protein
VTQEEVATYYLTYQQAATDWLRIRPFAERFTDNYLSIDSRWSVGVEAILVGENGRVHRKLKPAEEEFARFCEEDEHWRACANRSLKDLGSIGEARRAELEKAKRNAVFATRSRDARFAYGVGLGVVGELESATIRSGLNAISTVPESDPAQCTAKPAVTELVFPTLTARRSRALIRPFFVYRPSSQIVLEAQADTRTWLWRKEENILRITKPDSTGGGGTSPDVSVEPSTRDELDYHVDVRARLEYKLKRTDTSDGSELALSLSYRWLKDSFPPGITEGMLTSVPEGLVPTRVAAADSHQIVSLNIVITWGS